MASPAKILVSSLKCHHFSTGYVNLKNFAASLDAFCHWTYEVTNGYLMVVDIQVGLELRHKIITPDLLQV